LAKEEKNRTFEPASYCASFHLIWASPHERKWPVVRQFDRPRARSPFDFPRIRSARSGQALAPLEKARGFGTTIDETITKLTHCEAIAI